MGKFIGKLKSSVSKGTNKNQPINESQIMSHPIEPRESFLEFMPQSNFPKDKFNNPHDLFDDSNIDDRNR